MRGIVRINDISVGICCCHSGCVGVIGVQFGAAINASSDFRTETRCTDIVIHSCGHIGINVSCSGITTDQNIGAARNGDLVVGCPHSTIVSSSSVSLTI